MTVTIKSRALFGHINNCKLSKEERTECCLLSNYIITLLRYLRIVARVGCDRESAVNHVDAIL